MRAKSKTPEKALPPSWIAEREYTRLDVPGRVFVRVGYPEPDPKSSHGDWRCLYQIEGLDLTQIAGLGLDKDAPDFAHGVDSMQALQHALHHIQVLLKRLDIPLRWERTKTEEFGFPIRVPSGYGRKFERRMEWVIEAIELAFQERIRALREDRERREALEAEARKKARKKPRTK